MWVSDGVARNRWMPVSPVTGEIVPCEWKVPFDAPQGQINFTGTPETASPLIESKQEHSSIVSPPPADDPGIPDRDDD
jgi:HemY protein